MIISEEYNEKYNKTLLDKADDLKQGEINNMNKLKRIEKLDWEEIISNVGNPVWDNKEKYWRVLDGYQRINDKFKISFTDINEFIIFDKVELYLSKIEEE